MKGMILPLIVVVALAIPTMLGYIPVFLGVPAMLIVVVIKDVIFMAFARGLPMAIISTRMTGGMLWGVVKKTNEILVDKFVPRIGLVATKEHGLFNIMPERVFRMAGVPVGFAPENVGYNVGFDHLQFIKILEKQGINDIREITDLNEYGQIIGIKDDPRIKDIKGKIKIKPLHSGQIDLSGFNDFYRYCAEAANPFHQDANAKLAQIQGRIGVKDGGGSWKGIGLVVFLTIIALGALYMLTSGGGGEQIVRVIVDEGGNVIPA